ncbi:hypothetical protein SH661x_001558 [Planctomicrobium sp. SH661]|uniref:hypothetical protein n=1 Tax=Planctomicrobium sp. SH661 TaxID=3448124 RepID=UPI003F5AF13D
MIQGKFAESPKKTLADLLASLPESVSWDEIEYAIYVRRKIQEGQLAVEKGEYCSSEEARKRLQRWLK